MTRSPSTRRNMRTTVQWLVLVPIVSPVRRLSPLLLVALKLLRSSYR